MLAMAHVFTGIHRNRWHRVKTAEGSANPCVYRCPTCVRLCILAQPLLNSGVLYPDFTVQFIALGTASDLWGNALLTCASVCLAV